MIEIPAEPADPEKLPPFLQGFKAVAPLVTDINLSVDDRYLYVSCWGTGEFIQYDVTDPFNPKKVSSLRLGGIVSRAAHPSKPEQPLNGGPQMVEISRDGRRIYFTNSLYTPWDDQFYPDGVQGWMAKVDVPCWRRAWSWTRTSSSRRAACGRTRSGSKAATPRPTRTATRDWRERGTSWIGRRWCFSAPITASIPAWDGCSPWRLGMQQGSARGVWRALPPIALGHAAAVGVVLLTAALARLVVPLDALKVLVASMLMTLGLYRLWRHRHPRFRRHAGRLSRSDGRGRFSWPRRTAPDSWCCRS